MSAIPRVTIGMPVYNGGRFLRRALDSLLSQDFRDFELLISDNASSDGTWDILQDYSLMDSRIILHRQSSNLGAIANFQYALANAQRQYFMWAGCDDWWTPKHLGALVAELEAHPDAAAAMSATTRYRESGEVLDTIRYAGCKNPNELTRLQLAMMLASGELYHFYIYGLYRTQFLQQAFLGTPHVKGADRLFVCQVALSSQLRYVDQLSYMRQTYDKTADERYQASDKGLAMIYSDALGHMRAAAAMWPYLFASRVIPGKQKLLIPLLALRYAFWVTRLDASLAVHAGLRHLRQNDSFGRALDALRKRTRKK